jgi:N6-adenosine-specific RNA methylase IME4
LKKYNIIYADPPWQYTSKSVSPNREVTNHYQTMSVNDICKLPINELADKNCFLFLWATFPCLPEALQVINAWGFEYKTLGFNWIKLNKKSKSLFWGCGAYTRSNPEICLIAKKGKPQVISHSIHSVIITPKEEHSKKPDIVRDKIIELCGDLPRVELFARQKHEGWDSWGNEIESDFIMPKNNQTGE